MVKQVVLVKRKQGSSRDEFIRHYEDVYAPLIVKHAPSIKRYVRNYIVSRLDAEGMDFDCITEVWYDSMDGFNRFYEFWRSEAGKVIRSEEGFWDRDRLAIFFVEETTSE